MFAELNRGEDVTKGLRKVDKSEMTHKNPALRASSVVPTSPSPVCKYCAFLMVLILLVEKKNKNVDDLFHVAPKRPVKPSKPHALAGKKPPKFALEGSKWLIVSLFFGNFILFHSFILC